MKIATPLTMERYTWNTGGAAFGWANIPEQSGLNRPGARTPFANLLLAGHWTFPGGGIAPAMLSGLIAARSAGGSRSEDLPGSIEQKGAVKKAR